MKKLTQTRLYKGSDKPEDRGNCYCTVMACIMELDSPEDAFQVQEHFQEDNWMSQFMDWIWSMGYEYYSIHEHQDDGEFYFATGTTERDPTGHVKHICIYKDGELYWDPHPDQSGLTKITSFSILKKREN